MSVADRRGSDSVSLLNDDYASYSVEELFQKFSIKEVQNISRKHQHEAITAREELQKLVSSKYRDLIAITDEVTDTYEETKSLEVNLSDLAYRESKFINFNTSNNFSNFNKNLFLAEVNQARDSDKLRILDTVLNSTLLSFDLKVRSCQSSSSSPLLHTSYFIGYSKIYYVLETLFSVELETNKLFRQSFDTMKQNLNNYLKAKIASYNISGNSLYAPDSDTYQENQNFTLSNILSKAPLNALDENVFELEVETIDGGSSNGNNGSSLSDGVEKLFELLNKNTLPIVNYLAAYIILNSGSKGTTLSRSSCLFDFLQLRFDYLNSILNQIDISLANSSPSIFDKINFFQIFKFIENSFGYISDYFTSVDNKNQLIKHLTSAVKSWDVDKILGFPNWFDEVLHFNLDPVTVKLPKSSITDMHEFKERYIALVSKLFTSLTKVDSPQGHSFEASRNLVLFNNMIVGLKKTEVWCIENGFKSQLISLISTSSLNIATEGLYTLSESMKNLFKLHVEHLLYQQGSVIDFIEHSLKSEINDDQCKLFTSDFVSLINDDLGSYFNHITQAAINSSFSCSDTDNDIIKNLNVWFDNCSQYAVLLDANQRISQKPSIAKDPSFDLYLLTQILSKPADDSGAKETKWGKFNKDLLMDEFARVLQSITEAFWTNTNVFFDRISQMQSEACEDKNLLKLYGMTKILITLEQNLAVTKLDQSKLEQELNKRIETGLVGAYQFILDTVPSLPDESSSVTFYDQFEAVIQSLLKDLEVDDFSLPSSPSLKLSTLMFQLSLKLLNPMNTSPLNDYKNGMIFFNENGKGLFETKKNSWITKELISQTVYQVVGSMNKKLPKSSVLSLYANVSFLACFDSENSVVETTEIKKYSEDDIDDIDFKEVAKNITQFYEACKNTYYPLNV